MRKSIVSLLVGALLLGILGLETSLADHTWIHSKNPTQPAVSIYHAGPYAEANQVGQTTTINLQPRHLVVR